MSLPSNVPFYPAGSGAPTGGASSDRLALDNLLRRELRVSDPNDAKQVAQALLDRALRLNDKRAVGLALEAQGLPTVPVMASAAPLAIQPTASSAEWKQAVDDVEIDIQELTTDSLLKDIAPELQGWGRAVRSAMQEGYNAARFALDPRQRDKTFAIRRQLGDYARISRLIGALTPILNQTYRKFAQSLDEAASVLLVLMGEALANVGFAGGRYLLQAPFTELQVRRDAVIYALRNLVGATQQAYGPNDWPRGLDAYRNLFRALEAQGQSDLRSLLEETELSRAMDELISRAGHGTVDGLRALGSTAQVDLARFRRMIGVAQTLVSPESPPLTAFLEALQLFADAFDSAGGFRLLRIARPPILFYGLYGNNVGNDGDRRLIDMIVLRGRLAASLDCYLSCGCDDTRVRCQIALDKILYDIDRSIDLYSLGQFDFGIPERRSAAYGYLIEAFLHGESGVGEPTCPLPAELFLVDANGDDEGILPDLQDLLLPALDLTDNEVGAVRDALLAFAIAIRQTFINNAGGIPAELSEVEVPNPIDPNTTLLRPIVDVLNEAVAEVQAELDLDNLVVLYRFAQIGRGNLLTAQSFIPDLIVADPDPLIEDYLGILHQELCLQRDGESRWQLLVETMSPGCRPTANVFSDIAAQIDAAIALVSGTTCQGFDPRIPPHFETSLDSIVDDVTRRGVGRPF